MEKSSFEESFAPEENMNGYRRKIDPTSLSKEEFLIVDETIRAFNASHAIVQQDVAPLWKAANRSLVASTVVGAGMYQTAKKFASGKPNVPFIVAGISWILAYRVTNFFYRKDVLDNLLNGETKLSDSLRTALQQGQPQFPPAPTVHPRQLPQRRAVQRDFLPPQPQTQTPDASSAEFVEFNPEASAGKPLAQENAPRPRVNLLGGMARPTDENGSRKFATWDDIRARNSEGPKSDK